MTNNIHNLDASVLSFDGEPKEDLVNKLERTVDPRRYPPVIPPVHPYRTLVLCFDGVGGQFDADNSNIVRLVSMLKKDDRMKQLVYYQSGVNTYTSHSRVKRLVMSVKKISDQMIGWSTDAHVIDGYEFLMENYNAGDKICLFGFSRGAYVARSLAGMLYKVGLLLAGNFQQVPLAYTMYTRADMVGWEQSKEFKKAYSVNVPIEFIGVWDTVSSLGIVPKSLPVATACTLTRTFRHAISLDERRARFQANFWDLSLEKESHLRYGHSTENIKTNVEEVWFAGCHRDVGGGAVSNKTRHSLARIPLRWMIRECFKTNTGIMFNPDSLFDVGLDPSTLYPAVTPRPAPIGSTLHQIRKPPVIPIPINIQALLNKKEREPNILAGSEIPFLGTEEEEELHDAMSPKYDQLKIIKGWWILEILPLQLLQRSRGDNGWVKKFGPHLGVSRFIPHEDIKVHRSVKLRMDAEFEDERARRKGKRYLPKPQFHVEPTWVD